MTLRTPATRRSSKRPQRRSAERRRIATRRNVLYGVAGLVVALGAWLLVGGGNEDGSAPHRQVGSGPTGADGPLNRAMLFYVASDGTALRGHEQEIPIGEDTLSRARIVIEAQLAPPPEPLISPFPEGTSLRAIYIGDGGDAFVDLSPEITLAHPGGSLDELFTVYALVNALTTNLQEIVAVQILVDGREVDTLAGHVDLRRPLPLNMTWVAPSETETEDGDASPADN